ncbi:hypothetical protein MTX78_01320 [Hymenobacter tibetensis]|uniref:Roadblock/LAMTOR2 domain-containing protein n=1 Tax=Hymenobacter tibetensis TaxID=497967 RepID=A0ABY4CYB9_9BACT|nr:hypothetical protein [Hymenobacter tibetensis]UOG75250.1 hypothetical protein MTX78_01320 [Hymenobacter tibetensis]
MKPKFYRSKAPRRSELSKPIIPDPAAARVVEQVQVELPGLMAVAVVDVASGTSLAAHATASINPNTAASFNAEVVKLKLKAMAALQLEGEQLHDVLITLSSQLHLLVLTPSGRRFIYLVIAEQNTNLAIAREVLRAQVSQLEV